ncbi:MAG: hypothetical protein V3W41_14950 [Planctomycetota bacterium]
MSIRSTCNVCGSGLVFEEDAVGGKIECGHCHSIHRVRAKEGGGLELRTLIESLDFDPVEVAQEATTSESGTPKIKLKTWKDKVREEGSEKSPTLSRRTRSRR